MSLRQPTLLPTHPLPPTPLPTHPPTPTCPQDVQGCVHTEQRRAGEAQLLGGLEQLVRRCRQAARLGSAHIQHPGGRRLQRLHKAQLAGVVQQRCCAQQLLAGIVGELQERTGPAAAAGPRAACQRP